MENRFQDQGWFIRMVANAVRFIKHTEHLYEVNESSIQTLYRQIHCRLF